MNQIKLNVIETKTNVVIKKRKTVMSQSNSDPTFINFNGRILTVAMLCLYKTPLDYEQNLLILLNNQKYAKTRQLVKLY